MLLFPCCYEIQNLPPKRSKLWTQYEQVDKFIYLQHSLDAFEATLRKQQEGKVLWYRERVHSFRRTAHVQ